MAFGIDDAVSLGVGLYGAIAGNQQQDKANKLQQQALDKANQIYDSRGPLRQQGMQILGQSEAPINMGNLSYNAANPFAKAMGPSASNATRFQSQPGFSAEDAANALNPPPLPAGRIPQGMADRMLADMPKGARAANAARIQAMVWTPPVPGGPRVNLQAPSGMQPLGGQQAQTGPPNGMQPLGGGR